MIAATVKITPEIERIFQEMANDGYPVIESWVAPLVAAGFGGLPCIVIRNLTRHVVRVHEIPAYLKEKRADNDHLRYISTYPECIEAVKRGNPRPAISSSYASGRR